MSAVLNPDIVTDGLVLCLDAFVSKSYPGDGNIWYDLSNNSYNASLINSPEYIFDRSISFDGSNDYVSLSSPSDRFAWTPTGNGLNTMSIELWIKTEDTSGLLVSKPWNGNGEYNYTIRCDSFNYRIGGESNGLGFASIATGNWEHIVCIVTPTQAAIYINGNLTVNFTNHNITNNIPTNGNSNLPLAIMTLYPYSSGWTGNAGFSILGELSVCRIYNKILLPNEVLQNFRFMKGRFD